MINKLLNINALKDIFYDIFLKISDNTIFIDNEFKYITKKYSCKNRYYHNLVHIYEMIEFLSTQKNNISDFSSINTAVFYHDIIYNPLKNNNEEKSAQKAYKILSETKLPDTSKQKIKDLILRTKNHFAENYSDNFDTKIFLDADLKILSSDENRYFEYMSSVRKEYSHVPYKIYKTKRADYLKEMLKNENIYNTDICRDFFNEKAKRNIYTEIEILKNDKSFR